MATIGHKKVLKEGILQKRQRGKRVKGQNLSGLKFQRRFVSLNTEFLSYYKDKKIRGKLPVSSIAFVEQIPSGTFAELKLGFQIGNRDYTEVMYFGVQSGTELSEWMEAIRLGARISKNVMISHYHPGAFGKNVQGQWSCCKKKERITLGCCETGRSFRHERTQSAIISTSGYDSYVCDDDDDDDDDCCDDDEHDEVDDDDDDVTESGPAYYCNSSTMPLETEKPARHDTVSLRSEDSGFPQGDILGSRMSLLSIPPGTSQLRTCPEIQGEDIGQEFEENSEISQMLAKHEYDLLFTSDYGTALNSLDFRGTDFLIAGGKNGKVCVLDVVKRKMLNEIDGYSDVTSVEMWRSLLLISEKSGVWLRDLDDMNVNYQLMEHFAAFTPDGSRIITANQNLMEVKILNPVKPAGFKISPPHYQKLPGSVLLLCVSPDPKFPKVVFGVVKNERLVLCICDYMDEKGYNEVDIGAYYISCTVQAHFSPSEPILAVGHGKSLTFVNIAPGQLKSLTFTTEEGITSLHYSPIGDDLVIGMSDGNVAVLDGKVNEFSVRHMLEFSPQTSAPVTSIAFSKDNSLLALGHSDGRLNLVKRPFMMKRKDNPILPFRKSVCDVPARGGTLKLREHGITVVFPDGFVAQPSLTFEFSVTTHESYHTFPQGVRPVSVVFSLSPQKDEDREFLKDIEITMPHFIDVENEEDCNRLMFFIAGPNDCSKETLKFERIPHNNAISLCTSHPYMHRTQYATLYVKHCCHFCIGVLTREDTNKASFILTRAASKLIRSPSRELLLHHCFYYNLPTCEKLVKQQYPEESYTLKSFVVRFENAGASGVGIEPNSKELKDNGWDYYIENGTEENKIYPRDIDFWEIPRIQLEYMCQQRIYPPRFILRVFSFESSTCEDTHLKVSLPGVVYDVPRRKPILTVPLKGNSSRAESRLISRSTSQAIDSRPPQILNSRYAEDAVQSSFHFICAALSKTVDFAILLYSKSILSNSQLDTVVEYLGKEGPDPLKKIQNYKLLRIVQENISKDPEKFDALCVAFEELHLPQCSKKLQAALHKNRTKSASICTLSGSEKSSISLPCDTDSSILACEESGVECAPRQSETSVDPSTSHAYQLSESDGPPIVFYANAEAA